MDIADRIINLRKQKGWSQEDLAERLDVSRQSVSKWEIGSSVPDINRILQMSEIFGVTTDYLLKGSGLETGKVKIEEQKKYDEKQQREEVKLEDEEPGRVLSDDEIGEFMSATGEFAKKVAAGVTLCILSPVLLIGLAGFVNEDGPGFISETLFVLIGLLTLLIMVAVAVMLFIKSSVMINRFKYIKEGKFSLSQIQSEKLEDMFLEFEPGFGKNVGIGVGMCILSPIPLIISAIVEAGDTIIVLMVPVLLIIVAIAVNMFVKLGVIREGYMQLLKREEFEPINKKNAQLEDKIGGIYWPVIVAIYLVWSFGLDAWARSWMIFPIAGLIFAAITNAMKKN